MFKIRAVREPSGLRLPDAPPEGLDQLDLVRFYAGFYERDYARSRTVLKRRATLVVVLTAIANGLIAVVGAATATWGNAGLGVVSAGLAGVVTGVAAWDGLTRSREHWVSRSGTLNRLNALVRFLNVAAASGRARDEIAAIGQSQLDEILAADQAAWNEMRLRDPGSASRS